MHVALFSDTYEPQVNGVVTAVSTIARELVRQGHRVTVCTVTAPGYPVTRPGLLDRSQPLRIIRYASASLPTYKEMRVTLPTLLGSSWWVTQDRPDVIHSHTIFGMGLEAIVVGKAYGIPVVGTLHTFHMEYAKHLKLNQPFLRPFLSRIEPTYYNRCTLVTSPSRSLATEIKSRNMRRRIVILRNPVEITPFVQAQKDRPVTRVRLGLNGSTMVYLGRLSFEKNLEVLLELAQPVLTRDQTRRLVIVGGGPIRELLEQKAQALGIADRVIFTGVLKGTELYQAVAAADLFVTASLTENQPVSIIEAMAAGLPVVGFDVRGVPELVQDGVTGRVVPEDQPSQFSEAIESIFSDALLHDRLAAGARQTAETFKSAQVVSELIKLYQEVTHASRAIL
jgi:1,2-diacylglycerol 3-alpha-glucosyltransferase